MSTHQDNDELPTLDAAELDQVTGGSGMDMSTMLPMMLMMKGKQQQQPQAAMPPPAPPKPKLFVDGVEQSLSQGPNGQLIANAGDE